MARVDPNAIGSATLVMTSGFTAFSTFLPRISEVRKATLANSPDVVDDTRVGEVAASVMVLGFGLIASNLTGSPVPAVVAVIMIVLLVALYENVLRRVPVESR